MLVAKLVKDGNFFRMYLPEGIYRDLRNLTCERYQQRKKLNNAKNRLKALFDRYFPEYVQAFKCLLGQTSLFILKFYPFPADIEKLTEQELTQVIKVASNRRLGEKKARELKHLAGVSVGLKEGLESARYRLKSCLEEIEFHLKQMEVTEQEMSKQLSKSGFKLNLLSIPGIGVVTAVRFLGEVGDLSRFEHPGQIIKLAGFNLKGKRSGEKQKSVMAITKRGRSEPRCLLYQAALVVVSRNPQLRALYYFQNKAQEPLENEASVDSYRQQINSNHICLD
jgi:transposase